MHLRRLLTVTLAISPLMFLAPHAIARDLTFEDRVNAQEAIERVYYSHQIGATKPFDEAVPRAVLEQKVRKYLQESVVLETYWKTPITAEALTREVQRMARNTRFPDRLRELYAALGNDPQLVLECLARPALAERLSRSFFAFDQPIHSSERQEAEALHDRLVSKNLPFTADDPRRNVVTIFRKETSDRSTTRRAVSEGENDILSPRRISLASAEYSAARTMAPATIGSEGPVTEEFDAFVIRVLLEDASTQFSEAIYVVPKRTWEDWWANQQSELDDAGSPRLDSFISDVDLAALVALPAPTLASIPASQPTCEPGDTWYPGSVAGLPSLRDYHSAVWTGSEMIIWGGFGSSTPVNTGGRYDPATDTWSATNVNQAPSARYLHTAVWTGTEMIVWGGNINGANVNSGGRYDPNTDTWSPVSTVNAPSPRATQTAIWTGQEMIIWGGCCASGNPFGSGGRYNPTTNAWSLMTTTSAPAPRGSHSAIWTGTQMIVWGGSGSGSALLSTGGRYSPSTNTWSPTSLNLAPTGRWSNTAVWTGSEMIIWGGYVGTITPYTFLNTGARYNPVTDQWFPTSMNNAPPGRSGHTAIWSGSQMIVWGGYRSAEGFDTGGRYDPVADTWTTLTATNAPTTRSFHAAVWTGKLMIVWGGSGEASVRMHSGGRYDPAADAWTPTAGRSDPVGRSGHTALWTGTRMIVWGGTIRGSSLVSGGQYDPTTDTWTATTTMNSPEGRYSHSAVWTGSRMIVWGGIGRDYLNSGGLYDPVADSWSPTSVLGAPSGRMLHTAIWSGDQMIVWGGNGSFGGTSPPGATNTGGRYDPSTDSWIAISLLNAPVSRYSHTAVWAGRSMIVWGGATDLYGAAVLSSGGVYDPAADTWTSTSMTHSPTARWSHTAVWTGTEMIIWGGIDGGAFVAAAGSLYDPTGDVWLPMNSGGAIGLRYAHTAVWTGKEMIVWGGVVLPDLTNSGGRYDPAADSWTPTSMVEAPDKRVEHTAVWDGRQMIIWGGVDMDDPTGGRYSPDGTFDPPTVDAGPDAVVECASALGAETKLSGSGTGCGSLAFTWTGPFAEGGGSVQGGDAEVTLPVGKSTITLRVDDTHGQSATDTVVVNVQDTTPPLLTCPDPPAAECAESSGTQVQVGATATDACSPSVQITNSQTSGSGDATTNYPLGTTSVSFTASDSSGNVATCSIPVTVKDTTPPVLTCPIVAPAECSSPAGTAVTLVATAKDTCSATVALTNTRTSSGGDASGTYPLGSTPVMFTAQDPSGNTATCSTPVAVRDTTPPSLLLVTNTPTLWPPNHDLVPVHPAWQVHDACDANPAVALLSVTSSEPDDAPGMGDDNTTGDIAGADLGTADGQVDLRAERSGTGPGRVYQMTYQAVDASGNSTPAFAVVTVPHDQGQGPEPLLMRLEPDRTPGMVRMYWPVTPGSLGYDVISGDLSQLRVGSRQLSLGVVRVLARGTTETSLTEGTSGLIPATGAGIFYLIQSRTDHGGGGYGTESAPWPRVPASCEGGCP
jgi:N-acetylneuraminic acid mutarotase